MKEVSNEEWVDFGNEPWNEATAMKFIDIDTKKFQSNIDRIKETLEYKLFEDYNMSGSIVFNTKTNKYIHWRDRIAYSCLVGECGKVRMKARKLKKLQREARKRNRKGSSDAGMILVMLALGCLMAVPFFFGIYMGWWK